MFGIGSDRRIFFWAYNGKGEGLFRNYRFSELRHLSQSDPLNIKLFGHVQENILLYSGIPLIFLYSVVPVLEFMEGGDGTTEVGK